MTTGKFFVGTSNITLPGAKATFPEEYRDKTRLHYYSTLFNSLEVNSSFYKLPLSKTLEKWSTEVVGDFKFTLKLWKEITHIKELEFVVNNIEKFMNVVNNSKKNHGCILIQFPPSVTAVQMPYVERVFQNIYERNEDGKWSLCVEFRHPSWYANKEIYELLQRFNISLVIHDMPKSKTPIPTNASSVLYFRFHGPSGDYRGSYTQEFLDEYGALIAQGLMQGKDVYAYFNNTMGQAFHDAKFLKSKVSSLMQKS